ncbi:PrpF domain-containing protein [Streptomyces sp. NPDC013172]|uniref:PrpF domain-containing protein n=1 Tax=Streptomyces sp. NPDC013172 TaxID=3155009 RepID=UPI0033D7CFC8
MSVSLARAHGTPCPTAVVDARTLPESEPELLARLTQLRTVLADHGAADVLKNALVQPSRHPLFDLDYRFVQSMPDRLDSFDLRGSCGHSILAAVEAAARTGMIQPLVPGCRVRVNVLNNGDNVVCEAEETSPEGTRFTAHFLCSPPRPVEQLLITGEPVTGIRFEERMVPVSLVSMGNPYLFVNAAEFGVRTVRELFADDPVLFDRMSRLRLAVCRTQGWDTAGAFPKVAALLPDGPGALAVRAISVPSWHPTVALTGATCLAAGAAVEGTIPHLLSGVSQQPDGGMLALRTPGATVRASARTTGGPRDRRLAWISVADKQVDYRGPFLPASASTSEELSWLPLTA